MFSWILSKTFLQCGQAIALSIIYLVNRLLNEAFVVAVKRSVNRSFQHNYFILRYYKFNFFNHLYFSRHQEKTAYVQRAMTQIVNWQITQSIQKQFI